MALRVLFPPVSGAPLRVSREKDAKVGLFVLLYGPTHRRNLFQEFAMRQIRTTTELRNVDDADRFLELLGQCGLSQYRLAKMIDRDQSTVSRWGSGKTPIPRYVWVLLDLYLRCHKTTLKKPLPRREVEYLNE
jgi:hypothetical protein